jgi:predicted nucleotidyltransferase
MNLRNEIQSRTSEFLILCQTHQVKSLYAFGSSITDRFSEQSSDIDLVVEIDIEDPIERGEMLMSLWDKLEAFFERKVDLLTYASIKNPVLKENIDRTKTLIYDRSGQKVLV